MASLMTVLSLPIHMGDGQTGDNRAFAEGWAKRGSPRAPSAPSLVPRAPSLVPRALNALSTASLVSPAS